MAEEEIARQDDEDPEAPCLNFMKAAAPHLVPILLELLLKQEEGQEQVRCGPLFLALGGIVQIVGVSVGQPHTTGQDVR